MRAPSCLHAFVLAVAGSLAGCASLTANDCSQTDWYAAGLEDGRAGRTARAVSDRTAGCATGVEQDDARRYAAGRAVGLEDYCTLAGGIRAGREGHDYADVCSDETEEEFLTGYYLGALSTDP